MNPVKKRYFSVVQKIYDRYVIDVLDLILCIRDKHRISMFTEKLS